MTKGIEKFEKKLFIQFDKLVGTGFLYIVIFVLTSNIQ